MTAAPGSFEVRDCTFDENGLWFRYRAAAIIRDQGRVLMARNPSEPYYYSVGGGVHHGETAAEAVRREVVEETGVAMEIDRLAFIHENFFVGPSTDTTARCHELTFYFLMRYSPQLPLRIGASHTESSPEWCEWVSLSTYGQDRAAYPSFFATELLGDLADTPKWITTHEEEFLASLALEGGAASPR